MNGEWKVTGGAPLGTNRTFKEQRQASKNPWKGEQHNAWWATSAANRSSTVSTATFWLQKAAGGCLLR